MRGISHFIASYDTERPHSTLLYKTPEQSEREYLIKERKSLKNMRIPGSDLICFHSLHFDFSTFFFLDVPFLHKGKPRKRGLNSQVSA